MCIAATRSHREKLETPGKVRLVAILDRELKVKCRKQSKNSVVRVLSVFYVVFHSDSTDLTVAIDFDSIHKIEITNSVPVPEEMPSRFIQIYAKLPFLLYVIKQNKVFISKCMKLIPIAKIPVPESHEQMLFGLGFFLFNFYVYLFIRS